jgi:hypothetical protein
MNRLARRVRNRTRTAARRHRPARAEVTRPPSPAAGGGLCAVRGTAPVPARRTGAMIAGSATNVHPAPPEGRSARSPAEARLPLRRPGNPARRVVVIGEFRRFLLFAVLTCVPDDGARRELVIELMRVPAPGGLLYISDVVLQDDERNRGRYGAYGESSTLRRECSPLTTARCSDTTTSPSCTPCCPDSTVDERRLDVVMMNGHRSRAVQLLARKPVKPHSRPFNDRLRETAPRRSKRTVTCPWGRRWAGRPRARP